MGAAYLVGLAKTHGYVDGNKRIGFACAATFLRLNGVRLTASEAEAHDAVIGLVEGRYFEQEIADWIRRHSTHAGYAARRRGPGDGARARKPKGARESCRRPVDG